MSQSNQVHAPYHFVPLSKWVYMPDWAHLVSHDVPFKNGYSGVLEYTLTNATPLCVGGEQEQQNGKPSLVKWARDPNNNPVIPGSSLKGMIRNVMEIATFGKFSAIDDSRFSFRDISKSPCHYLDSVIKQNKTVSAWLKYDHNKNGWTLHTCQFAKIKHAEANTALNTKLINKQSAVEKYQKHPLSKTVKVNVFQKQSKTQGLVNWVKDIGKGAIDSHIVFCNNRINGPGKAQDYDFSYCFYGPVEPAKVDTEEINALVNRLFASHDEKQVQFLQENQHATLGIPVFALFNNKSKKLKSLGLAKMPRVLYNNAASDLAKAHQGNAGSSQHYFDMGEIIFGTLRDKGLSLKSRVFFADAILNKNNGLMTSDNVTLNGPKATFKGAYLEQPIAGKYQDYDDKNTKLAGWKRYITSTKFKENKSDKEKVNVESQLELLNIESEFTGKIIFHNLKPEELGALIWAIQLGSEETNTELYHGLGHGKSLGAGAVQFKLSSSGCILNGKRAEGKEIYDLVNQFTAHMTSKYPESKSINWQTSPQIQHLQAIANMEENKDRDLSYHHLNDFKVIKKNESSLAPIEVNSEALNRAESAFVQASGSLSFGQGRLSTLFSKEDESDTWVTSEKAKQKALENELNYEKELAEKQRKEAEEAKKLAELPEDFKLVAELTANYKRAITIDDKRLLNASVESLLDRFINENLAAEAAQNLCSLVKDKTLCEYLNIKNKKKLKPRKAKLTLLCEKYGLSG